ncbi:hypothetical protein VTO73DRAFT_2481 [Trametes versicolor]
MSLDHVRYVGEPAQYLMQRFPAFDPPPAAGITSREAYVRSRKHERTFLRRPVEEAVYPDVVCATHRVTLQLGKKAAKHFY